ARLRLRPPAGASAGTGTVALRPPAAGAAPPQLAYAPAVSPSRIVLRPPVPTARPQLRDPSVRDSSGRGPVDLAAATGSRARRTDAETAELNRSQLVELRVG